MADLVFRDSLENYITADCIDANRLPTACQSDTEVLLLVKTKNRIFSAIV